MYPFLKCIHPEGFAGAIQKFRCEEYEHIYIDSKDVEAPYFETKPIGEFEPPEGFPNCCNFHRSVLAQAINRMEKFPDCCAPHKKLKKASWFSKKNYEGVPLKTVYTLAHTEYHIVNRIEIEDWYKDITDYIEYCVSSFGRLPDGYGNPIGLFIYLDNLKLNTKINKGVPKDKKAKLLSYIDGIYNGNEKKAEGGFNILLSTYSKWIRTFPFELSMFQHLKQKYKKTLPFLKSDWVLNPYSGISKARLKTQEELIMHLIFITEDILYEINSLNLYEKGLIGNLSNLHLELALKNRRLAINQLKEKPVDERSKYIAILKQWFEGEVLFLNEIKPILSQPNTLIAPKPTKAELLEEYVVKQGFFELPKVSELTSSNKKLLLQSISENDVPYAVAMFDHLRFFDHLTKVHGMSGYKMHKEVAKWLGTADKEGRNIRGNMNSLSKNSREDKGRYTAYQHKEKVIKDYQSLKLGRTPI